MPGKFLRVRALVSLTFIGLMLTAACTHLSPLGSFEKRTESQAARGLAGSAKPRHMVIAVHGIGGNETTWGYLGEALAKHLSDINPNYETHFFNFTYAAKGELSDTFDYGEILLSQFIESVVFKDGDIQPEDKISIIAHSQGGLVASIWYTDTLVADQLKRSGSYRKDLARFAKYADQVDTILTLGTPFWGSKLATRSMDPEKFDPSRPLGLFNEEEMKAMAFGANTIYQFRRSTIALSRQPQLKSRFKAKMINLAGIVPKEDSKLYYSDAKKDLFYSVSQSVLKFIQSYFFKIGFGDERYESDIAVLAPSTRLGFLYNEDLSFDGFKSIEGSGYKEADFFSNSTWVVTESIHAPIFPSVTKSMAYVPASCLDLKTCDHPTYRLILESLSSCEQRKNCDLSQLEGVKTTLQANAKNEVDSATLARSLRGFTVEVVLRLPDEAYDLEDPTFKNRPGVLYYKKGQMNIQDPDLSDWVFSQAGFFKNAMTLETNKSGKLPSLDPLVDTFVADQGEYLSRVAGIQTIAFDGRRHKDIRIHLTGYLHPTELGKRDQKAFYDRIDQGLDIPIEFHLPGLQRRKVQVRVKPGFSSFLEIQLNYADQKNRQRN